MKVLNVNFLILIVIFVFASYKFHSLDAYMASALMLALSILITLGYLTTTIVANSSIKHLEAVSLERSNAASKRSFNRKGLRLVKNINKPEGGLENVKK